MNYVNFCGSCNQSIVELDDKVQCKGKCKMHYHSLCVGLKVTAMNILTKHSRNLKFVCDDCEYRDTGKIIDDLSTMIININRRMDDLIAKEDCLLEKEEWLDARILVVDELLSEAKSFINSECLRESKLNNSTNRVQEEPTEPVFISKYKLRLSTSISPSIVSSQDAAEKGCESLDNLAGAGRSENLPEVVSLVTQPFLELSSPPRANNITSSCQSDINNLQRLQNDQHSSDEDQTDKGLLSELTGVESPKWLFVSRLNPTTSSESLQNFIATKLNIDKETIRCVPLISRHQNRDDMQYVSYKVLVHPLKFKELCKSEIWPKNVITREFKRRNFRFSNRGHKKTSIIQTSPFTTKT